MPFPFLAHQAAVLPLKLGWPLRLSGTALVLGSLAPDLGYFLIGAAVTRDWHRLHGLVLYCLPVAMVLYLLLTRVVAAPLARHLPRGGGFALHRLAYLEAQPRTLGHLGIVAACIVLGAGTHLGWDLFTHDGTWMGAHVPWLERELLRVGGRRVLGTTALWFASTLVGGLASALILREVGRRDLLRRWAEGRLPGSTARIDPEAAAATSHVAFWAPIVLVTAAAAVGSFLLRPSGFGPTDKATAVIVFLRSTALGFVALVLCAWRERRAWRHRSRRARQSPPRAVDPAA